MKIISLVIIEGFACPLEKMSLKLTLRGFSRIPPDDGNFSENQYLDILIYDVLLTEKQQKSWVE